MPLADELCPECHGEPVLFLRWHTRGVWRCLECGHRWLEEIPPPRVQFVGRGGWVRLAEALEDIRTDVQTDAQTDPTDT